MDLNARGDVIGSIRNKNGVFQDASPFLLRATAYGDGHKFKNADFENYPVGKFFLYHSPSWFTPSKKTVSFNHIELELDSFLPPGQFYKMSFLISNFKSHRYKPAHYGVKFSESRILKEHPGTLLSKPGIFFDFEKDQALDEIQAIFYANTPIKFIYFGMFVEDTMRVRKEFTPYSIKQSYSDTAAYIQNLKPTRVIIDNILIEEIKPLLNFYKEVFFDSDEDHVLRNGDLAMLRELTKYLLENPKPFVLIEGFTDDTGTAEYNLDLSKRRAESIKQLLVAGGISPTRVVTLGRGILDYRRYAENRQKSRKSSRMLFE